MGSIARPRVGNQPGPAWYDEAWKRRWPVAIDAVTGTDSGTVDVEIVVPKFWDWFWDGVQDQTNGYDIILCGPDGVSLLSFAYSGLNFASRTLTLQIDGLVLAGTGKMEIVWLYWYKASPSDLTSSVTITSALSGYIEVLGPVGGYVTTVQQTDTSATIPETVWSKKTTETLVGWADLSSALSLAAHPYNERYNYEGVQYATVSTQGVTPLEDDTLTRYTYYGGRLWVSGNWSGGADDTDYDGTYTITTTEGRVLDHRVVLSVDDLD